MKKLPVLLALALALLIALPGCFLLETPPEPVIEGLSVTFLDVGQADCTLIRSGANIMLIDAGTNAGADSLVAKLYSLEVRKFDVVVATHPHEDHIGGMDAVIENFEVGSIIMPQAVSDTKTFMDMLNAVKNNQVQVFSPALGTTVAFGEAKYTLLAPNKQEYDDMNNYSIVLRLTYGSTAFLFTGDAESVSEREMLARDYNLSADVLKIGHHGSESSTTGAFLDAVYPKYAVIMVGTGNDYGHPDKVILDKLKADEVKVYRTDKNGSITFTSDGENITVSSER